MENAEDLLEHPAAPGFRSLFKNDFFEECQQVITRFPAPYCLNAEIILEDWENHNPQELAKSFRDSLGIMQNTKRMNGRRALFLSAMFVIAGFLILALMVCGQNLGWFGSGFSASLWEEVVDIAGTVFLWEAVTVVFLETSEQSVSDPGIRKRIASLTFRNTDGTLLLRVCDDQLFQLADRTARMKQVVRDCLLVSGCGFVLSAINALMFVLNPEFPMDGEVLTEVRMFLSFLSIFQVAAGVGGFYLFWDRRNVFTALAKVYVFCELVITVLIIAISTPSFTETLSLALSGCSQLLFIFSLFVDGRIAVRHAEQAQKDKAAL